MLSDDEIVRRLRVIRHSPTHYRNGHQAPSINALSALSSLSRKQIYRICQGEPLGPRSRAELSQALSCDVMTGARSAGHRQ